MVLFFAVEIVSVLMMLALILTNDHLRKRDTIEAKRIFSIAVFTIAGSVVNMLTTVYDFNFHVNPGEKNYTVYIFILALLCCIKEMMSLQIAMVWNLFVDYGIYRSYDHVIKKYKRLLIPCIVLSVLFVFAYVILNSLPGYVGAAASIMDGFTYLCLVMQFLLVANAAVIVLSARKGRKPPSFLRIDAFIIPVAAGYVLNLMPVINKCDYRSICTAIAVVLTWKSVMNRYKYVDPFTGFYNKNFLSSMNEYMEKSGYPNGTGVYFKAEDSEGKLIPVLDGLKPADSEIFSLGEDEYLLMAGSQKESVIRLLIKSVKLKTAEELSTSELKSAYAIRGSDESTEAFTHRLLGLAETN